MIDLLPDECRVLGVLVEKAQTTPALYPLTLNSLVAGCNQKNNRDPVTSLGEEAVLTAIDGLRSKQLVREVMLSGSRVAKYKHNAREALNIDTNQLIILTELLLRGPQTVGELRGRASRMHPLESTDIVENVLKSLMERTPPVVKYLPPTPGSRAGTYVQLLCPKLHPLHAARSTSAAPSHAPPTRAPAADNQFLERIEQLEAEVADLRADIEQLKQALHQPAAPSNAS